jgi:protein-arginine kinase activator protein McsA
MTNGDFIRSMTDEDITENFTRGICELIKHRDPERCQNREHCFHCVKDWAWRRDTGDLCPECYEEYKRVIERFNRGKRGQR